MTVDRVAAPSYRADGSEHGATTQTSGGESNHVVIGSPEDRKAHPELYPEQVEESDVVPAARRSVDYEKATE